MDSDLDDERLEAIGSHLYSGDEWDLVPLDSVDLGLPASTRRILRAEPHYAGGLVAKSREPQSETEERVEYEFDAGVDVSETEERVEYEFDAGVDVEAVVSVEDAESAGWKYELDDEGHAHIAASFLMKGWAGVVYEGDEIRGWLEYIGLKRADGTVGHPLVEVDDDTGTDDRPVAPVYHLPARARLVDDTGKSE